MVRALHSFLTFMRNVASQWLVVSETEQSQIKCCVAWDEATTPQPAAPDPQADPSHNSVSNKFFMKIKYLIQPKRLQLFAFWYRYTTCCLISKKTVSGGLVFFLFWISFVLRRNFFDDASAPTCSFLWNILPRACCLFWYCWEERESMVTGHAGAMSMIYPPKPTEHAH